jgi:hypothetical protein
MLAVLSGKLAARREDCAPVAGKSTLNRLELSRLEATRYVDRWICTALAPGVGKIRHGGCRRATFSGHPGSLPQSVRRPSGAFRRYPDDC